MQFYLSEKFFCRRTNSPVKIQFVAFNASLGNDKKVDILLLLSIQYFILQENLLCTKHRAFIAANLYFHDIFIYQEDDMIVTPNHIAMYAEESDVLHRLSLNSSISRADIETTKTIGFLRIKNKFNPQSSKSDSQVNLQSIFLSLSVCKFHTTQSLLLHDSLSEEDTSYHHICLGDKPYIEVRGNTHQALWMLSRWQVLKLQKKCKFLNETVKLDPTYVVRLDRQLLIVLLLCISV